MASQEQIESQLERYEECLNGRYLYLDTLVHALCLEEGLWTAFCKAVTNKHGRKTREQIKNQILSFLCSLAQEALKHCRKDKDWIHKIYSSIQCCTDFTLLFFGPAPRGGLVRLNRFTSDERNRAQDCAYKILGVDPAEYNALILQFARRYVIECRNRNYAHLEMLTSMGAENNLDIKSVGSSTEEVHQWLFQADLKKTKEALKALTMEPLHVLASKKLKTSANLALFNQCLDPDDALSLTGHEPWYMRARMVTPADLNFGPEDIAAYREFVQKVERSILT